MVVFEGYGDCPLLVIPVRCGRVCFKRNSRVVLERELLVLAVEAAGGVEGVCWEQFESSLS